MSKQEKRKCSICFEYNIPSMAPEYRDKCMYCYYKQPDIKYRVCKLCRKSNIPTYNPVWKIHCRSCHEEQIRNYEKEERERIIKN